MTARHDRGPLQVRVQGLAVTAADGVVDKDRVRLSGDALDRCRRRVQQELHGRRGLKGDALYRSRRRTLHTDADLLTDRQAARLDALVQVEEHGPAEAT